MSAKVKFAPLVGTACRSSTVNALIPLALPCGCHTDRVTPRHAGSGDLRPNLGLAMGCHWDVIKCLNYLMK
jgi:hypothetical protein